MYYAATGLLAAIILLIENQDIFLNRNSAFDQPAWKMYRRFLFAVLIFYITDVLWGFVESLKQPKLLYLDTCCYFIIMAAGVVFWTQYVVLYLDEKNRFGRFLIYAGNTIAGVVTLMSVINIFVPMLFVVDENCVYYDLAGRDAILMCQILLLLTLSAYTFSSIFRKSNTAGKVQKYRTISIFALIMAVFLFGQMLYPYLPLYAVAYLLGTCLLRAVIIGNEKEEYRGQLEEAEKIRELKQTISALVDNMPALSFSKDAETGVYLACNQAFAEYAHKENPEGVVGLTDAQIFDAETAQHFVEDDRMALSMNEPYIFFEDVPDAAGNQRQFQTTKLKFVDASGRLCTLGMCQDVTDMVRIQRENATTREAYEKARSNGIIFTHIAQTLAHGYEDLYYVNLETGEYMEYHTDEATGMLAEVRRGQDFFESAIREAGIHVYPDDRPLIREALNKDKLADALDRKKSYTLTYRLITEGDPSFVNMKISRMEDDDRFIILGVTNVNEEMKQRRAVERVKEERIAYARLSALAGDFISVYVVSPETGSYREFSSNEGFRSFALPQEGDDFFGTSREQISRVIHPDDLERFLSLFTREGVLEEIDRNGIFALSYRLIMDGRPNYVQLKAAIVDENEGRSLIVGINDIDTFMRQEEDYARRLAQAQSKANIDALTGVRNKHAYLEEEEKLDHLIKEQAVLPFAIVILDVNDLKKVNDTVGHQAGDQYLRDACKLICDTFKRSPVFRVGGDEFAVIAQGEDYATLKELVGRINDHNSEASHTGGIVVACGMSKFERDRSVAEVFERADAKMYENKSRLKDQQARGGM